MSYAPQNSVAAAISGSSVQKRCSPMDSLYWSRPNTWVVFGIWPRDPPLEAQAFPIRWPEAKHSETHVPRWDYSRTGWCWVGGNRFKIGIDPSVGVQPHNVGPERAANRLKSAAQDSNTSNTFLVRASGGLASETVMVRQLRVPSPTQVRFRTSSGAGRSVRSCHDDEHALYSLARITCNKQQRGRLPPRD